jgi:hypothetical protein
VLRTETLTDHLEVVEIADVMMEEGRNKGGDCQHANPN